MFRERSRTMRGLDRAFADGLGVHTRRGSATLHLYHPADLIITTGRIVACDPGLISSLIRDPFAATTLPGRYPVILTIAHTADGDQHVAYATLRVRPGRPARWSVGTRVGGGPETDDSPSAHGYTVYSGLGCFMDATAMRVVARRLRADPAFGLIMAEAVDKTFVNTWGWANITLEPQTRANLVVFSVVDSDVSYVTYVGYDGNDNIVCFVTDFAQL